MINILWDILPCSNLQLCQFMVSYELREQDYLVALDDAGDIIAAGLLAVETTLTNVDVVVEPQYRQQGIGKALVNRLLLQADQQGIERVVSHGEQQFWQKVGFECLSDNLYGLLLPAAAKALVTKWYQGIPVTQFLELNISNATSDYVETSASMTKSINVHQSMFAGAIYSQAVLTGWGLIHLRAQLAGVDGSIVLASGDIKYRKPITSNPRGVVIENLPLASFDVVSNDQKLHIELTVNMYQGDESQASAQFIGRYVILPKIS